MPDVSITDLIAEAREATEGWVRDGSRRAWRPFDQEERIRHWATLREDRDDVQQGAFRSDLKVWEDMHDHDVRLKCYPEFQCAVIESYSNDVILRLADALENAQRTLEMDEKYINQLEAKVFVLESVTAPTDEERVARILAIYSPLGYPSALALIEAQTRMLEQENIARSAPSTCEAHTTVAGDPWWGCELPAGHEGRHVYGKRLYGAYPEYGIEAAPSDTDREALRRVAELASGDHITESLAEYRDATSPDSEPTEWELEFWHAGYKRGALSIIDHLAASQPVQVEVTDEMVERAGRVMYISWDEWAEEDIQAEGIHTLVRSALEAALGGGDHE